MTEIINLTPHAVTLRTPDGDRTFPPSGTVARVATTQVEAEHPSGLPCARRQLGEVTGLPAGNALCIVSTMVFDAHRARTSALMAELAENPARRPDFEEAYAMEKRLLVPDSGSDAYRSGPDREVEEALNALSNNAAWAADGMPCSGAALTKAFKVFEALAARQQGQIEATRRFIIA